MMTSFDLEHIHLGSLNLHLKKFLYGPTYPPNFVFLALKGAEIAGADSAPPPLLPPGRIILRPSQWSVLSVTFDSVSLKHDGRDIDLYVRLLVDLRPYDLIPFTVPRDRKYSSFSRSTTLIRIGKARGYEPPPASSYRWV